MLYIWMPETNGVWHWSNGENWLQAASLDQLIQDLQIHQGKEATVFFRVVMLKCFSKRWQSPITNSLALMGLNIYLKSL